MSEEHTELTEATEATPPPPVEPPEKKWPEDYPHGFYLPRGAF